MFSDKENALPKEVGKGEGNDGDSSKKKSSLSAGKCAKSDAKKVSINPTVTEKDKKDNISESKLKHKRPRKSYFVGNYSSSVFLPRQSFFSCHDNALVKHGLNPHTLSPLETRRR